MVILIFCGYAFAIISLDYTHIAEAGAWTIPGNTAKSYTTISRYDSAWITENYNPQQDKNQLIKTS